MFWSKPRIPDWNRIQDWSLALVGVGREFPQGALPFVLKSVSLLTALSNLCVLSDLTMPTLVLVSDLVLHLRNDP